MYQEPLHAYVTCCAGWSVHVESPHWFVSSLKFKFFFLVCLPHKGTLVAGPKFMFVVSNIIIIFLVGESRLFKSSAQPDTYDECMMRSQVPQLVATVGVKEEEANVEEEPSVVDKAKEEEEVEEEGRPAEESSTEESRTSLPRLPCRGRKLEANTLMCCQRRVVVGREKKRQEENTGNKKGVLIASD
ncbi:hypothetical protein BHM03_00018476 [Ensete ventricosum]|nr:hypothetical protein BHM03_00018476 [Ensete ventricosum]